MAATSNLQNPIFTNEDKAREALEAARWPDGPFCPHCGNSDQEKITKGHGKVARPGLFYCAACNGQFTATVGTVFERSKIPLTKWWLAMHLLGSSKKGISSHQLHRMLGVTYKTAWFMTHRIREAMKDTNAGPIGGEGKTVEADETYFGQVDVPRKTTTRGQPFTKSGKTGPSNKRAVVALVERGGEVRMMHMEQANAATVREALVRNVDRKSKLHTDESRLYTETGKEFADHRTVKHSAGEYVRYEDDGVVHSNTVENVFSVFKRGMTGVYQHCGESHLHRYLTEFEFRYNRSTKLGWTDAQRALAIAEGIAGKRLTYRRIGEAQNAQAEG